MGQIYNQIDLEERCEISRLYSSGAAKRRQGAPTWPEWTINLPFASPTNLGYIQSMIRIGTQGWSYKDWVGNFYPEKTKPTDYLSIYAKGFDTVELDASFYAIPRPTTVDRWRSVLPDGFILAAKFPRQITHESDLTGVDNILNPFLDTMSLMEDKLGPLLIQFPYSFKPDMADKLYKFLNTLPEGFDFVVEVRNRKWLGEEFYDRLHENNVGLAILDHPWMPKPEVVTSDTLYVRLLGDRKQIPDDFSHIRNDRETELNEWNSFLKGLQSRVEHTYAYFNNHYSGHSPTTAERFRDIVQGG